VHRATTRRFVVGIGNQRAIDVVVTQFVQFTSLVIDTRGVYSECTMANEIPPNTAPNLLPSGGAPLAGAVRNPFWNNMAGFPSPIMGGFAPYNQLAAYAAAQENALPMVSLAKLASSKSKGDTNSSLVVRGSLRRTNTLGGTLSVAEWTRKTLEENLEWLVKLAKRHATAEKAVFFTYGDGCETLLLIDEHVNVIPKNLTTVKKIFVGCSMGEIDSNFDEEKLAKMGVLQPKDSIWEHLRFETISSTKPVPENKKPKGLFIHTKVSVFGESIEGRRRVLQVTTGSNLGYKPNPAFEQHVLNKWKEIFPPPFLPMVGMTAAPLPLGVLPTGLPLGALPTGMPLPVPPPPAAAAPEKETVITFNSKELLLLEKAFDNRLTERDTKATATKCTPQDKIAAQAVIRRAQNEFVVRGPSRKRKPKSHEKPKEDSAKKVKTEVPIEDSNVASVKKQSATKMPNPAKKPAVPKKSKSSPVTKERDVKPKSNPTQKKEVSKSNAAKQQQDEEPMSSPPRKERDGKPSKSNPTKKPDDDDVPISKMVSVKKNDRITLSSPPKKARRQVNSATKPLKVKGAAKSKESPMNETARGRPKGTGKKQATSPKKIHGSQPKM